MNRVSVCSLHVAAAQKASPCSPNGVRDDSNAVGGFFEDLPVMAFVLAGVLTVTGTACWASAQLSQEASSDSLERSASLLVMAVVDALGGTDGLVSIGATRSANLSGLLDSLPGSLDCLVSVWCIHPDLDLLVVYGDAGAGPVEAHSERALVNVLLDDGVIGILEVRVLVWAE